MCPRNEPTRRTYPMKNCRYPIGFASLLLAFAAPAYPQAASQASAAPSDTKPSTVVMSPFEVNTSADSGYIAADTMSSSRLNTNLLTTPSDVSVLTNQFLNDIGTYNLADAEVFLTSASPVAPVVGGMSFGTDVNFRGLPNSNNTRNYFNMQTNTINQYIVERVEGMRGSNSILYGPTAIGGEVNILTKQAQFHDFGSVSLRTDAYGSLAAMVDVDRAASDKLAVRVNAVDQKQRSWVAGYYDMTRAADFTTTYRPFANTEIRFEAEDSERKTYAAPNNLTDSASNWNGIGVTAASKTAPAGSTGVSPITTDYLVMAPAVWGDVQNFNGYGKSTGSGLSLVDNVLRPANFPVLSAKGFRSAPSDSYTVQKDYVFQLNIDQKLPGNGNFEFAAFRVNAPGEEHELPLSNVYVDVNQFLPNGNANPEFGKYYSEGTLTFYPQYNQYRTDYRAAIDYPLISKWGRQDFTFIADQWGQVFDPIGAEYGRTNNATTPSGINVANAVEFRQYWDKLNNNLVDTLPAASDGQYNFGWIQTRHSESFSSLHGYSVNTSGSYFGDKLNLVGGVRRDDWSAWDQEIGTLAASGQPATMTTYTYKTWVTTANAGFVYFPEKYVGVYAGYQEGFNPITVSTAYFATLTGNPPPPTTVDRGRTAGIRLRLLDGRIVGSLGYYDAHESQRVNTISTTNINTIWNDLNLSQNDITTSSYLDTYDYKARGLEGDITANLTQGLRLTFNVALPTTEQSNANPGTIAYYNKNITQWQTLAAAQSAATQANVSTNIQGIQSTISNSNSGRPLNGTYKYRANAFGIYEFHGGSLKGLRVGGGANVFGKQLAGSPTGQPYVYYYSPAYATYTALAGYTFKLGGQKVDLQLNVNNLFNYGAPIYTSLTTLNGVNYFNSYWYTAPRNFILTAKYSF